METIITTQEYKGYSIAIGYDDDPMNPRTEWDNFGTIITSHRRYSMGDDQTSDLQEYFASLAGYSDDYLYNNEVSLNQSIKRLQKTHVVLPVYMYDHSGIALSTGSFVCSWDSGLLGFIFVSKADAKKEFGKYGYCKRAAKLLENEIETYDQYCRGTVLAFEIQDADGEYVDSCYGFYGDENYVLNEAKQSIDYLTKSIAA